WAATSAAAPGASRCSKRSRWPPGGARMAGGAWMTDGRDLSVVGRPLAKPDAAAKVTGVAVYADDLHLPRMLHCRILRSPHPHARIVSVDASAARRIPGVKAVLTGQDLPIRFGILPVSQDERALEFEKVRYVGDPVA